MTAALIQGFYDTATQTVTHVLADPDARRAAVIDPVLDYDARSGRTRTTSVQRVLDWLTDGGYGVDWLLETHAHADHLSAAPWLQQRCGGRIAIGAHIDEVQRVFRPIYNDPGLPTDGSPFDHLFREGDTFQVGSLPVTVWHTPGHTLACVCYRVDHAGGIDVFIGDTLFMPDYGSARCDFPGGDARALYRSVRRLLALPPDTRLHLCHDYPPDQREPAWVCTVARQRRDNVHLHDGIDEESFVAMRTTRDRTLGLPQLLVPAVQVNLRAGHFPDPESNGVRYLKVPVDLLGR